MANFTPGPWNAHRSYLPENDWTTYGEGPESFRNWSTTLASGDTIIADFTARQSVGGWPHVENIDEARANFDLCMAAPEMYEAICDFLHGYCDESRKDFHERMSDIAFRMRIAKNKAEGK